MLRFMRTAVMKRAAPGHSHGRSVRARGSGDAAAAGGGGSSGEEELAGVVGAAGRGPSFVHLEALRVGVTGVCGRGHARVNAFYLI